MQIFLWWGIFVASTPVLDGAEWLVVLGPIFLTLLLLFVSGIPLLEVRFLKFFVIYNEYYYHSDIDLFKKLIQESGDKKYGNVAAYRNYKKTTRFSIDIFNFKTL